MFKRKNNPKKLKENIIKTINAIDEMSMAKDMAVVKDHHICYGEVNPLCRVVLGGRGLTVIKQLITCPQCRGKLKRKSKKK